ncbi:MAG: 4Fe-4S binding protein [Dehalococcoidia bacterium]|nr:4Fe-4S binding protein [Dehalococcoidia bacterium]MDD5494584.1 4Fe-4S binding protein [Dehalococcoidia bacterium]
MVDKSKIKVPKATPQDLTRLPIKMPKITIDHNKCTVPFWCKKCLQACPQLVFQCYCKHLEKLRESDPRQPGIYEVIAVRRDKCHVCNKCVEMCPENAITITLEEA